VCSWRKSGSEKTVPEKENREQKRKKKEKENRIKTQTKENSNKNKLKTETPQGLKIVLFPTRDFNPQVVKHKIKLFL
jgi:hypothetical protein